MSSDTTSIKFVAGSRKLFEVQRRVQTVACDLEQLISGIPPDFGDDTCALDGYRVLSLPESARADVLRRFPRHTWGGLQHYRRHYIDMAGCFADYLTHFSGKTRSTLTRKRRKLEQLSGGTLDVEEFRGRSGIERFFAEAIPVSRLTYQTRLLDAGLPEDETAYRTALGLASQDRLRAFLLRVGGHAIAYLYLPVEGATLMYSHLGYDPGFAKYSPGTVLQLEALERLFAEERYRYFDFTEGEGAHKAMFGTDWVEACSFFLLRASWPNRLLLGSLDAFDWMVAKAKHLAARTGILARARRILRS